MQKPVLWGIMGTGWSAERFSAALAALAPQGAVLHAVGSRTQESAQRFADAHNIPHAYGSYEALVNDPSLDVIYIATPHRFHFENARLCIEAGKAVLCEKAFTVNAQEAEALAMLAKQKRVFVMEAFWTRFQPLNRMLHQAVCQQNQIGTLRMMQIDFDKIEDWPDTHRIYNPDLAGGAMLDLGVYTMNYACFFLGADAQIVHAAATIGKGGVDDQCAMLVRHQSGALSVQTAALQTNGRREALLLGTRGSIRVPNFSKATYYEHTDYATGITQRIEAEPFLCNGYEYEAIEVMDCLRSGKLQSDIMPLDTSIAIMRLLDACRADYGFTYPFE